MKSYEVIQDDKWIRLAKAKDMEKMCEAMINENEVQLILCLEYLKDMRQWVSSIEQEKFTKWSKLQYNEAKRYFSAAEKISK